MTILSIDHRSGNVSSPNLRSSREEIEKQAGHFPFQSIGSLEISAEIGCTQSWVYRDDRIRDHVNQRPHNHLKVELSSVHRPE